VHERPLCADRVEKPSPRGERDAPAVCARQPDLNNMGIPSKGMPTSGKPKSVDRETLSQAAISSFIDTNFSSTIFSASAPR
jgi:hypothetical protein